ncbi:putative ribonuclease H protein, partial [Trifolium medium]|nr:putative ribonuclease H protein [Trifolium medium]
WDIVGSDVTDAALHVLNHKGSSKPYNHTYICLIPKKKNPTHPSDFRPISLCRLITDNTLVAYEVFHHFNQSNSRKGFMGIKTDMAKAYDRVEWNFLKTTLESMGFPHQLTDTIMECVTNVNFSILINGTPSQPFSPQRGLRQGDPLSPYLFIICANVLSGLITKAQSQKKIHGPLKRRPRR